MTIAKVCLSLFHYYHRIVSEAASRWSYFYPTIFTDFFFPKQTLEKILYMSLELCICYYTIKYSIKYQTLGRDSCTCGQIKIARPKGIFRDYFMIITKQCKRVLCTTLAMVIISSQVMRSQFSMKIIGTRAVIKNQQSGKAQC